MSFGSYGLRESERAVLVKWVNDQLEKEIQSKPLVNIVVVQKTGRQSTDMATFDADELAILQHGDAVVDQVLEQFGNKGGKFALRATFQPETGPGAGGIDRKQFNKAFALTPLRAEQRTKSQGASAGIEQLTASFGAAFDAQGRQLNASVQQQTQLMGIMLDRTEQHHTTHLQEITEYQRIIMEQQLELTQCQIQLAHMETEPMLTPEHLGLVLPAVVQLLTALTSKLTGDAVAPAVAGATATAAVEGAAAVADAAAAAAVEGAAT